MSRRAAGPVAPGLDFIARRNLAHPDLQFRIRLHPGDRALVREGDPVTPGQPIVERLRDRRLSQLTPGPDAQGGDRIRTGSGGVEAELLHPAGGGRWRAVGGSVREAVEAPAAGRVVALRSGSSLDLQLDGLALPGVAAIGGPSRGRLELAVGSASEPWTGPLDVGRSGSILVLGPRVDAQLLIRARAMGVRGVVVAGLGGTERRDLAASERRQRAVLHGLPPFGVLVLDGALRRPIAAAVLALLGALAGTEVAIVSDPPALVFEPPSTGVPMPSADRIRVRHGPLAGEEGRFLGLTGPRRYETGTILETGLVELGDGDRVAIPLADLERYA